MNHGDSIGDMSITIGGDVSGQVAAGSHITQSRVTAPPEPVTAEELDELRSMFAGLRDLVRAEAPPEGQAQALDRVEELEQAVMTEEPDLSTMEYVKRWFGRNLPKLAGSVTGLVVHPIVGKLVGAAGEALAAEFRRRFGDEAG